MPQTRTPYLLAIAVLLLGLILAVGSCRAQRELQKAATQNFATLLTNNETYKRNAEGQLVTLKNTILIDAQEFSKMENVKDSTIRLLQKAVKDAGKKTTAAVVFTAVTHDRASGAVDSIHYEPRKDTLNPEVTQVSPVYYGYITGPGFKGLVRAGSDSINLVNYSVTQKYTVAFVGAKVLITPLGTNTQASDVQAFELPPAKKPKRLLWAAGGSLLTFILLAL